FTMDKIIAIDDRQYVVFPYKTIDCIKMRLDITRKYSLGTKQRYIWMRNMNMRNIAIVCNYVNMVTTIVDLQNRFYRCFKHMGLLICGDYYSIIKRRVVCAAYFSLPTYQEG